MYVLDAQTRQLLATSWYRGQPGADRSFGVGFRRHAQPGAAGGSGGAGVALVSDLPL